MCNQLYSNRYRFLTIALVLFVVPLNYVLDVVTQETLLPDLSIFMFWGIFISFMVCLVIWVYPEPYVATTMVLFALGAETIYTEYYLSSADFANIPASRYINGLKTHYDCMYNQGTFYFTNVCQSYSLLKGGYMIFASTMMLAYWCEFPRTALCVPFLLPTGALCTSS